MKNNVQNILFRVKLKGNGIVNFDSDNQKWDLVKHGIKHLVPTDDNNQMVSNTKYAKKRFFKDADGNPSYKIAISSTCLGKAIYADHLEITTPMIGVNDILFMGCVASPASLLRGYVQTRGKNSVSYNRKGTVTLSDAVQSNGAISSVETMTKAGSRSATSLYNQENVSDIEYEATGIMNLQEMQFYSVDTLHSRAMFSDDLFPMFSKLIKSRMPEFDSEIGYYTLKTCEAKIPEKGFVINDECMLHLVKFYFSNLIRAKITRAHGHAAVHEVEYKLVTDTVYGGMNDTSDWIKIKSQSCIDSMSFGTKEWYQEYSDSESDSIRSLIDVVEVTTKENKKKKNEEASARKAAAAETRLKNKDDGK